MRSSHRNTAVARAVNSLHPRLVLGINLHNVAIAGNFLNASSENAKLLFMQGRPCRLDSRYSGPHNSPSVRAHDLSDPSFGHLLPYTSVRSIVLRSTCTRGSGEWPGNLRRENSKRLGEIEGGSSEKVRCEIKEPCLPEPSEDLSTSRVTCVQRWE